MATLTYILQSRVGEAADLLRKLSKKAAKFGGTPITFAFGEPVPQRRRTESGRTITAMMVPVTVEGAAPRVGDYTFVARVEHHPEGNLISGVPGVPVPERFRTADSTCDHCQKQRSRKDTFVVADVDGHIMQVGRTCLRDFLGTDNPEEVVGRFKFLAQMREAVDGFGGGNGYAVVDLLTYAHTIIRARGFLSSAAAKDMENAESTANAVLSTFGASEAAYKARAWEKSMRAENVEEVVNACREWATSGAAGTSDYAHNLRVAMSMDYVDGKHAALIVSGMGVYLRKLAKDATAAAEGATSGHVGTVGERVKLTLTVMDTRTIDSRYGVTVLHTFKDATGNIFKWFASGNAMETGKTVTMAATIKGHGEFRGAKETTLTRCKAV